MISSGKLDVAEFVGSVIVMVTTDLFGQLGAVYMPLAETSPPPCTDQTEGAAIGLLLWALNAADWPQGKVVRLEGEIVITS